MQKKKKKNKVPYIW